VKHLSLPLISASLDDALSGPDAVFVTRHLGECSECRGRAARLTRIEELMRLILVHEPGIGWYNDSILELAERLRTEQSELASEAPKNVSAALAAHATSPAAPVPEPRARVEARPPETATRPEMPAEIEAMRREPLVEPPRLELAAARAARPKPAPAPAARTWGTHAERIVRSRRDVEGRSHEPWIGLVAGLTGGALAGGLIVGLILFPRSKSRPDGPLPPVPTTDVSAAAPMPEASASAEAAITSPAAPPEVVPARAGPPAGRPATSPPSPSAERPAAKARRVAGDPAVASRLGPIPAATPAAPATPSPTTSAPAAPASRPASAVPPASSPEPAVPPRVTEIGGEHWPLLCGIVHDEYGQAVAGARVVLADLDVGARTDEHGRFCVSAPAGPRTLSLTAAGFAPVRAVIVVQEGRPDLDLMLHPAP
jgi:hypothetical protein